jgi:hypothetical protein
MKYPALIAKLSLAALAFVIAIMFVAAVIIPNLA